MTKKRSAIPLATKNAILGEFNHRCAICGSDKPQIHHIDGDHSNNDPMNLIPLCPNCHLTDQHSPTQMIESNKLSLFRKYKDPCVLKPQFHPLYLRLRFLKEIGNMEGSEISAKAKELIEFVRHLEMGGFYAQRLSELIREPSYAISMSYAQDTAEMRELGLQLHDHYMRYKEQVSKASEQVFSLVVELLRFQKW